MLRNGYSEALALIVGTVLSARVATCETCGLEVRHRRLLIATRQGQSGTNVIEANEMQIVTLNG